jgi:hypothetical protein
MLIPTEIAGEPDTLRIYVLLQQIVTDVGPDLFYDVNYCTIRLAPRRPVNVDLTNM